MVHAGSILYGTTAVLVMSQIATPANYSAQKVTVDGIEVVRLADALHRTEVSIAPSLGNNAYEMKVNGTNLFWNPFASLADFKAKPALLGNPFLAPWANRLDHDGFFANRKEYKLNPALGNVRRDGNGKPIHGLLLFSPHWKVTALSADDTGAGATSRLEFWRYPDMMAQFPFAHTIEMTYRLQDGALEVETKIENHASEPMPVSVGYHPYFKIHDAPRDEWRVHVAAKEHLVLSNVLIPTGEKKPLSLPDPVSLAGTQLDDVFSALVRGESGRAEFWVQGSKQKISVLYGEKYPVAVVYAPRGRDFICFEPMSGPTNAFNLVHAGIYEELQTMAPGGVWKESYWIVPSGF